MMTTAPAYREQLLHELNTLPDEYLPYLLQLVQTFRDSVLLKPAAASFAQGWKEARRGELMPIAELWELIDDE
jgi:UDP-N-acetylmuramoylalanine-D-glutamate ligase